MAYVISRNIQAQKRLELDLPISLSHTCLLSSITDITLFIIINYHKVQLKSRAIKTIYAEDIDIYV